MRVLPVDSDEERDARRVRRYPRVIYTSSSPSSDSTDATESNEPSVDSDGDLQDQEDDPEDEDADAPTLLLAAMAPLVPTLSNDALCDVMDDTFNKLRAFRLSGRAVSSGVPSMGWDDQRLVDGTGVKFQLRKHFATATVYELTAKTWRWLSDPQHVLRKFNMAARGQTLQRVNDDLQVAIHDALTPDGRQVVRCVYVLCRMRTPRGFIICVRSFNPWASTPSALEPDSDGRSVQFANVLGWFRFDAGGAGGGGSGSVSSGNSSSSSSDGEIERRRAAPGVRVECGGDVDFGDATTASTLAMASLWMALQWESLVVAPLFHVAG